MVPGYAHAPFSPKFLQGFCSDGPLNIPAKFEVRSFTVPEIIGGTPKLGQSLDTPTLPFLQNFSRACVRMHPVNIPAKFEVRTLPVPEIIGGSQKIWAVPGYAHAPFSPKFFTGLCSDAPCEYACQI